MKNKYDTFTTEKTRVSYLPYTTLFELGFNPSSKGTFYLKGLIEYIIVNNLYDYSYKNILKMFTKDNNYELDNVRENIRNSLRRVDYFKIQKNFKKYLDVDFDYYFLSPTKFINILALKYSNLF